METINNNQYEIFQYIHDYNFSGCKKLLSEGCDMNVQEHINYNTPLMFSIINKYDLFVDLLIGAGANVNLKNRQGLNALFLLIKYNFDSKLFLQLITKTDDLYNNGFSFIDYLSKQSHNLLDEKNKLTSCVREYETQKVILNKAPLLLKTLLKYKILNSDIAVEFEHLINGNDLNLL